MNTYVFDLGNLLQNENYKYQIEQIISIFNSLLKSNGENVVIPKNNRNLFLHIMNILGNDINEQITAINIVECEYKYNNKLNGIISYIQQITKDVVDGSNDHLRLSASGIDYFHPIGNIIQYDKKNINSIFYLYETLTNPRFYIDFNFVNRLVNITGYTIMVPPHLYERSMPKTWTIYGSNDEQKWEVIDMKENNNELSNENRCVYFECTKTKKFFKYIRFEYFRNYFITLNAIKFFGYIA